MNFKINHSVVVLFVKLCTTKQNLSKSVNVVCDGVRVSGGHLCEAEAPTEATAETSFTNPQSSTNLFRNNNPSQIIYSSHKTSCGAQNRQALLLVADDFDRYASLRSLHRPPDALATSPVAFIYKSPLIQIVILLFVNRGDLYCYKSIIL